MPLLSKYLHDIRLNLVQRYVKGDVLDLGCGSRAEIYRLLRDRVTGYCGIDNDSASIKKLQREFPEACFAAKDLDEDLLDLNRQFDCILMVALIEHIFNQKQLMKEAIKCLKPNGKIIVTTPTPFGNDIIHRLGTLIGLFHPHAADDHIVIYNKKRLQILAEEIGLKIVEYKLFELRCNQLVIFETKFDS